MKKIRFVARAKTNVKNPDSSDTSKLFFKSMVLCFKCYKKDPKFKHK